jgi:carboxypeptidase family protein
MKHRLRLGILLGFACILLLPAAASAQSAIVGLLTDDSGGVLPGVTVAASSPVMIEGSKTTVTDGQGRYRFVEMRPGVYKITFALTGFGTVVRDGVNLPSNFTATVNAEMRVGSLEETVNVSGTAPQVDVQQATRTTVIPRDVIDTLPISRNVMGLAVIVPGVRPGTPDMGGIQTTEQVSLRARGLGGLDGDQLVEGMSIQSYEGTSLSFLDDTLQSEMTVSTAAIPADTGGGGIRLNSILKDGGNQFSGSAFMGGTKGTWVANNIDDRLRSRGLSVANGLDHLEAFTASLGGPIFRDRLWWILSARHQSTETTLANVPKYVFNALGERSKATNDLYIRSLSTRLTWQATKNYKVAGFIERWWHKKGHSISAGTDYRAGEQRDPRNAHHSIGNMKLTAPVTSKWLVEAGYSWAQFYWKGGSPSGTPAGIAHDFPFTPEWYATAPTTDTAFNFAFPDKCAYASGCLAWNATREQRQESLHNEAKFAASYVTGSHNIKVGVENDWGPGRQRKNTRNGHLQQRYNNNQPSQVEVFNNPVIQPAYVAYDVGIFAQDSWTLRRLTINPGLRVQWVQTGMYESSMAAGRFAPARFIEEEKGLINFGADYSPRFSAVYDLFGDGRTALKTSWSKYYRNYDGDIAANAYGRAGERSELRAWFDRNLVPGTSVPSGAAVTVLCPGVRVLPTDCDGIAQDNEIGISPSGGAFANPDRPDRRTLNLERQYNDEFTAGVQHQVTARLAVGAMFYKRKIGDLAFQDRTNIGLADYTVTQVPMPDVSRDPDVASVLKASDTVPLYNLNPAKLTVYNVGVVDRSDTTNDTLYTGVEASFNARLPGGAMLFGSWTADHTLQRWCDNDDDPNGLATTGQFNPTAATTGTESPLGGRYCDQTQFPYPFRHEFKFAGNYMLPYGIDFGAILQSYAGGERVIFWQPAAAVFPGGVRTQAETFVLTPPGSVFYDRWNQLDVNVKKNFRHNNKVLTFQLDVFNVLNSNAIRAAQNSVGTSLGNATTIMLGRFPRLAFNFKF